MNELAISTAALARRFGRTEVLRGVDLDVPRGSVTALLGRNGGGKSTLLRVLLGIVAPSAGRARVLGLDPARDGARLRARVGYAPDHLELPAWTRVRDHLRMLEPFFPTWSRGEERRLLDRLELDASARVRDLSKGSRTKLALVAALAHEPELLVLDEPFSGLDPLARASLVGALLESVAASGRTVLLVSHSIADVERVADRIAILDDGKIAYAGDLEETRRLARRFLVELADDAEDWSPPGAPVIERAAREATLLYLDATADVEGALRADPRVRDVRALPRDLDDLFGALVSRETKKEEETCVESSR